MKITNNDEMPGKIEIARKGNVRINESEVK